MFYSKTTGGFYSVEIHGDNTPTDAVEITNELHTVLLEGQSQGRCIVADDNGYPELTDLLPSDQIQMVFIPISSRQIRQALTRTGIRTSVEAAVVSGDQDLKDWWEFSTEFDRLSPEVIGMGVLLGQTDDQLDALWVLGATL